MADLEPSEIVISDLYSVPRANDAAGKQVRPRLGASRDGYTCPVCKLPVILVVSGNGNPFFRHVHAAESCRAEPLVHLAAREILCTLIDHARAGRLRLIVRAPCGLCGAGHEIPFPLGDATEASDVLLLEPDIAETLNADVACTSNGTVVASIALDSESSQYPLERQLLDEPWVEVNAAAIKSSNTLRKGVYQQRDEIVIRAVSSSEQVVCTTCHVRQERAKKEEEEQRQKGIRDQVRLNQYAHRLAQQLGQLPEWWIQVTDTCLTCYQPCSVRISSSHYDQAKPSVTDAKGKFWQVGLLREGQVVLGVWIVPATYDGTPKVGSDVPYAVVPLLDDPFSHNPYGKILITKAVHFAKQPKLVCLHCEAVKEEEAAERQHAEALRQANESRRRQYEERVRREERDTAAAKQKAEEDGQRHEAESKRQREERQRVQDEERAAQEAARVAKEKYERSPRGQLERLVETVTSLIVNHDQPTFLATYRDLRRTITAHRNADPTAAILANEVQVRLDRMAKHEWVSVQKREHQREAAAEQAKQQAAVTASWEALLVQLQAWRQEKEWTIQEEMAIGSFERVLAANPKIEPPARWGTLVAGRKRQARPPEVRAEVAPLR